MQQFQTMHGHVGLLAQPHRGTPLLPAKGFFPQAAHRVQLGAEESEYDRLFHDVSRVLVLRGTLVKFPEWFFVTPPPENRSFSFRIIDHSIQRLDINNLGVVFVMHPDT
jgi:hypothetical protein